MEKEIKQLKKNGFHKESGLVVQKEEKHGRV